MMATDFGTATLGITDIPLISTQTSDPIIVIGQRVARRLLTPRGGLAAIGDDPNFGWDVRQYLNGRMSPVRLAAAQQQIKDECEKDEAVLSADVQISFVSGGAMKISIELTGASGPFTLVLDVSQLTVTVVFG